MKTPTSSLGRGGGTRPHSTPTVLVAGATGYIGRHTVRALHDAGYRVRALARDERRLDTVADACEVCRPARTSAGEWEKAGPGDSVLMPRGLPHAYYNRSEADSRAGPCSG
jgi:nucleoside-diphosphate-sugar epimerase